MSKIRDLFGKIIKPEIEVFVEQTKKSSPFIYTKVNEEYTSLLVRMINEKTNAKIDRIIWGNGFRNFANAYTFDEAKNVLKNNDLIKSLPFRIRIIEVKSQ